MVAILEGGDKLSLHQCQVGTLEREERLALFHTLPGEVDIQVANPSLELQVDVREAGLIVRDDANGGKRLVQHSANCSDKAHARQLLASIIDDQGSAFGVFHPPLNIRPSLGPRGNASTERAA